MLALSTGSCSRLLELCSVALISRCSCASMSSSEAGRSSASSKRQKNKKRREQHQGTTTDPQEAKCDLVGPADSKSNLRPTRFYIPRDETPLERRYRESRAETQEWNQSFWADHNAHFKKLKEEFIQVRLKDKYGGDNKKRKTLSADEMSEFYKKFLDDHRLVHKAYNREWYKKNANNLLLAARVWLQQKTFNRR